MGKILITSWALFSGLGIYRGVKKYNFDHKKMVEKYEERLKNYPAYNKSSDKPRYYTSNALFWGILGFGIYANPMALPIMICREIHRLEINLRGYDDEKEKDDYYNFF